MNWYKTLDPRIRVVTTIWLMILCFSVTNVYQVMGSAFFAGVLLATNGFNVRTAGKLAIPFLVFLTILTLINMLFIAEGEIVWSWGTITITDRSLTLSLLYSYRLAFMFMMGAFLVRRTTQTQIADSFESLMSPLKKIGVPVREIALVFSLALRFIPTLTEEARQLKEAQMTRGASLNSGSIFARISALVANIIPIFAGAIRHADALSLALEARGWNMSENRTHLHPMKTTARDWMYLALICALTALCYISL